MRAVAALLLAATGCSAPPPATPRHPTAVERRRAVRALTDASGRLGAGEARTLRIASTFTLPSGVQQGRGMIAVRPPRDLRMQLLGPGGTTALDLWISGAHDRLAIPPLGRVERDGGAVAGRPQGFLRWWLLAPLSGKLLWIDADGTVWLRALDGAVITVKIAADRVRATRTTRADVEYVDADLAPCGRASYRSEHRGLGVEIACESVGPPAPARAFEEPP